MDERWSWFGVTAAFLESKASWLNEARDLHGKSLRFFQLAGKLVWLSRDDYELSSLAFFQAIIGLERALRLHFASEEAPLALLFRKAVAEGIVTDSAFAEGWPLSDDLRRKLDVTATSHCHALSVLVPRLRNDFMHGTYLLSPDHLYLTLQMREIADVLKTKNV
jgi:hypothetical protein